MAIIGIDFGLKRIGLAFSNDSATIAFAGPVVTGGEAEAVRKIVAEAVARRATEIVIGLPRNMNGTEGQMSTNAKAFAEKLREQTEVPVILWDERLTSVQADRAMRSGDLSRKQRKTRIDSMAAQLMLQSYLDARKKPQEPGSDPISN